jgi:hypothetical protein
VPWDIEFTSFQQKKTRHIGEQDWSILERHLKDMEALLNRISLIEPKQP